MKMFAFFGLVLAPFGALIGLFMLLGGNAIEQTAGSALLGAVISGSLLCCAVMALADIRDDVRVLRNEMQWKRDRDHGIDELHCHGCGAKVKTYRDGRWDCTQCNLEGRLPETANATSPS